MSLNCVTVLKSPVNMCLSKEQCFLILAFLFASTNVSLYQTQLAAIFSDQMILQQQVMAGVWGTDTPNTK
ncbi:MAG TPA: hypothetical protein VLJ41_16010, partial [Segetibacter sp.]|nr:hypothetical protein [Segetibacter sp.]